MQAYRRPRPLWAHWTTAYPWQLTNHSIIGVRIFPDVAEEFDTQICERCSLGDCNAAQRTLLIGYPVVHIAVLSISRDRNAGTSNIPRLVHHYITGLPGKLATRSIYNILHLCTSPPIPCTGFYQVDGDTFDP